MLRGVSGGQKKRVTTGEMVVGPKKTLFMDEISTGLDSSTTYQIVNCVRNFVHVMEGTVLMALLQPAPETFDLFDDLILLSEGYLVYHGPRSEVLEFFESLGFRLPPRKSVADFLQESTQNLFVVMGALYASVLFLGVNNASSVQPIISIERTVFYREKAAGMYSPIPYAFAQGLVEIPYILVQTIVYGIITYFMINFERTASKLFLYLLFMFLTFAYFTFYGMMVVGLSPTQNLAAVVSSAFYSLWNLLSGFLVPKPSIPGWWIWFYYICPIAWTLRGIITSQLGDVETITIGPGFEPSRVP